MDQRVPRRAGQGLVEQLLDHVEDRASLLCATLAQQPHHMTSDRVKVVEGPCRIAFPKAEVAFPRCIDRRSGGAEPLDDLWDFDHGMSADLSTTRRVVSLEPPPERRQDHARDTTHEERQKRE